MTTHAWILMGLLVLGLPCAALAGDGSPAPSSNTEGASRVVALVAGQAHTCALQATGRAVCWGSNEHGQVEVPEHAGPFISLAAGASHSCGLQADGRAVCWGAGQAGETGSPHAGQSAVPQDAAPFTALAAGDRHTCGLKADGQVDCWGGNESGQATDQSGVYVALSAGARHTCAVMVRGSVDCWGDNDAGQAADHFLGAELDKPYPFLVVSAGAAQTCAIDVFSSLICWGNGDADTERTGHYIAVSTGDAHTCGLSGDGSVACWGRNDAGQAPASVAGAFTALVVGGSHTCGLKVDGGVACWGAGGPGSSGGGNVGQSTVPTDLGQVSFGQIASGNAHACQVRRDGTLGCWGNDDEGQATVPAGQFTQVVAGDSHGCAIGADGAIRCWGRNGAANTTEWGYLSEVVFEGTRYEYQWRQLAPAVDGALCALAVGTEVAACVRGDYSGGYFKFRFRNITHGLFPETDSERIPLCGVSLLSFGAQTCIDRVARARLGPWQRLESGLGHQCGLKGNGTLECWDGDSDGQADNMPNGRFRAFSLGWNHACAIRENGELACWGSNLNGQATPPAGTYVQVAAGNTFTCAIRNDGARMCWGDDAHGQAPQLQLTPHVVADGVVGMAHAGADFVLGDFGQNADGDYVPPTPVFFADPADLPPGLSLSAAGVLSGTPTAGGSYTFTVEGEDVNGFAATREYTVTITDNTPPLIDDTLTPPMPDGSNGWYVSDVGIAWTVNDAESAITSSAGCGPTTLSSDTAGATFSCTATSTGGTSSKTTTSLKRDATPPTITAAATTAPNANGWYSGDVTIHFTCSDATSGVVSCPADVVLTASGSSATPTMFDNAGNSATSNAVTVQIDKSAPSVVYAFAPPAPDGNNGWYRGNVGIDWTIGDTESGIGSSTGCVDGTLSSDTAGASWTCTATNGAGLQSSVTTATIKRDGTAPTLIPTVPSPLLRGKHYSASPNAADALSGIASASCGALDTSSLGNKSTTCSATDNAGNSRTVTLNYTVTTTCVNDGYKGTQLTWCKNICEMGYTGAALDTWIHRWVNKYRDLPYCMAAPPPALQ